MPSRLLNTKIRHDHFMSATYSRDTLKSHRRSLRRDVDVVEGCLWDMFVQGYLISSWIDKLRYRDSIIKPVSNQLANMNLRHTNRLTKSSPTDVKKHGASVIT